MKKPELSIAKIDKYYNLRAKYDSAVQDYSISPIEINNIHKKAALGDLLLFCLETVADLSGDKEFGSTRTRGINLYG